MTNTSQSLTLQEYLNFDDHTETRYELVSGKLITMPPESDRNQGIVSLLFAYFLQLGMPLIG
jgi:Uma2 family endonuclease